MKNLFLFFYSTIFYLFLFFTSLDLIGSSTVLYADEDGAPVKIGEGQAVTHFDPHSGFQLSELAKKTLKIEHQKAANKRVQTIPKSALVYYQNNIGIYRFRNNWFKLIPIKIVSKPSQIETVQVEAKNLLVTDEIVTQGVPLLRVVDLEVSASNSKEEVL